MTAVIPVDAVGPYITVLGTFGGIWAIVRMFNKFQQDFAERYRKELIRERIRREKAEARAEVAELYAARLEVELTRREIPLPIRPEVVADD